MSEVKVRIVKCPQCGNAAEYSAQNAFRPFCSERCRLLDIGDWADEKFKVPTRENAKPEDDEFSQHD